MEGVALMLTFVGEEHQGREHKSIAYFSLREKINTHNYLQANGL
jgi:hypothetical protein